jgi:hypothetical protein
VAEFNQLPGKLNIAFNRGDEVGLLFDFDINTTGYSWSAEVYSLLDNSVVASPAVTVVDAAAGKINMAMTEGQSLSLAAGSYGISISCTAPGSVSRRMIEGLLEVLP